MNIFFNMPSYLFCLAFILMLGLVRTAQNFEEVKKCPESETAWKKESDRKNCLGDTPDYMCAAIEKRVGKFGEICTKHGLTPAKKCAVLNAQTKNLDSVDCKAASGCPTESYLPSVLWKYPTCYDDFYEKITTLALGTTPAITNADSRKYTQGDGPEDGGFGAGEASAVVIILIIVVVVVLIVFFYVRNQFGFKDEVQRRITDLRNRFQSRDETENTQHTEDVENGGTQTAAKPLLGIDVPVYAQPHKDKSKKVRSKERGVVEHLLEPAKHVETEQKIEKLKELLKYLVYILKKELEVDVLKEKAVIHSKSINEHFTEPLKKELHSVKCLNDYSQFDMSLVLALLWNFCDGIKPPSRGWDYEPPDGETHVGADIERIKSMWNKYCDDDLQFRYLDDVYNRMIKKYGTVAVHGDNDVREYPQNIKKSEECFELPKDKIQSIKLNPDCVVEKGIVITESITETLKVLKSRNVVILKGVMGCGKTYALKAIQTWFQEKDWETKWMEQNIQVEKLTKKPKILLCDNLFGRFGNCVFSQDVINKTENVLETIESYNGNVKVVIGIHTHVYDEVKKSLKLNFLNQKNISVEMDKHSNAETLLIFKEQHKKGHCKMNSSCWFKTVDFLSVLDRLSKNQGHIGGPFLSLMYCNQHELFSDEAFSVRPVEVLMNHFQRMRLDSPTLYRSLVYLMCIQKHYTEEKPKEWAKMISKDITRESLKELVATSGFVHVEEGGERSITLAHEILSIALFKSACEEPQLLFPVAKECAGDIIIQLLRPLSSIHSDIYCAFVDVNKSSQMKDIGKAFVRRLATSYKGQDMNHPVKTVEFVSEKYQKYLDKEPKYLQESIWVQDNVN